MAITAEKMAFNGMIDAIIGDLKYAFTQFNISNEDKERGKGELIGALKILTPDKNVDQDEV